MRAAVFEMYLEFRERIPAPSPAEERPVITLPLLLELKVRLWQTMIDQDISQADLTRRLGKDPQHVRCLLDPHHGSKVDQLEAAFAALGRKVGAEVQPAA